MGVLCLNTLFKNVMYMFHEVFPIGEIGDISPEAIRSYLY